MQAGPAFCLGWKPLHEKADRITLQEAWADVQREPQVLESLYTLALVYLNLHKIDEAEKIFQRMEEVDSVSPEARWGLAEVLRRRHRIEESQPILEEIIKEKPDFSPAYTSLGYMLFDKKEYERSIQLATTVLRQGPDKVDTTDYVRAYLIIGGAKAMLADSGGLLSRIVNGSQILPYFKKAQKLQPDSAGVFYGLGSFYLLAPSIVGGDKVKGLEFLEKAVKADPLFVDAYARLAQGYKMMGDEKKAKVYLDRGSELDPQNELTLTVKKRFF